MLVECRCSFDMQMIPIVVRTVLFRAVNYEIRQSALWRTRTQRLSSFNLVSCIAVDASSSRSMIGRCKTERGERR